MPASLDRVLGFAHGARRSSSDALSDATLARAYDAYRATGLRRLAGLRVSTAGRSYASLYDAIRDESVGLETVELTLTDPPAAGPAWDFLRPVRRVELFPDGSAELHPPYGPPQHAIARLALRESNAPPNTRWTEHLGLAPFPSAVDYLRSGAVVPFNVALMLYLAEERARYEIDLTDDALLKDPRAGRLSAARKVRRTSRTSWAIDRHVASGQQPLADCRLLEVLAELRGATVEDIAPVFGGNRDAVHAALERLAGHRLALLDASSGHYRVRLDAFRGHTEAGPGPSGPAMTTARSAPASDPALQKDLADLIASADARATCPLCGDELPARYAGIVCARCAAEIAEAPGGR